MKKFSLAILSDGLFVFVISFFTLYGLLIKYGVKIFIVLPVSAFVSGIIACGYTVYAIIKFNKKSGKALREKEVKLFSYDLCLYNENEILTLLKTLYEKKCEKVEVYNNSLIIPEKRKQIFFYFSLEKTNSSMLISAYKHTKQGYNTVFYSISYSNESNNLLTVLKERLTLFSVYDLYDELKKYEIMPQILSNEKAKPKFFAILKNSFSYKNYKKFLFIGIVILLSSIYSFYPLFYTVVGVIMLITSLYLRFFKNKNA